MADEAGYGDAPHHYFADPYVPERKMRIRPTFPAKYRGHSTPHLEVRG